MMNITKNIFLLLFSTLAMEACSSNGGNGQDEANAIITCSQKEITAKAEQAVYNITVSTTRSEWTAYSEAEWMKVTLSNTAQKQGSITLQIDKNIESAIREANVVVKSGTAREYIKVKQLASIQLSATSIYTASKGESKTITVKASEAWEVITNDSWIEVKKIGADQFTVITKPNDEKISRVGKVFVKTDSQTIEINVKQESINDRTMNIPNGYTLVWNDEFDGSKLNEADWTYEVKKAGWVNNELQNYIKDDRTVFLEDGKLNIHCFKDKDGKVYSGRINAKRNTGWKYGYMEARIKLPKGKGTWPAFWMMPVKFNAWPADGEIDIMEEVGVVPNEVSSSIHCTAYNHQKNTQKTNAMVIDGAEGEYHIYALEWDQDYIKTYVDGKPQLTFLNDGKANNDTWPFNKEFYIIFNLAWGGDWGGMKGVDETALPITMQVDYVRVFQKK